MARCAGPAPRARSWCASTPGLVNDTIAVSGAGRALHEAVRTGDKAIAAAIAGIDEDEWRDIDYTPDGEAQVAECAYTSGRGTERVERRLVARRTRLTHAAQARLWPDWRHFAFLTDLDDDAVALDAFHREHAVVELAIRDLKEARAWNSPLRAVPRQRRLAAVRGARPHLVRWTAHARATEPPGPARGRPHAGAAGSSPSPAASSTGGALVLRGPAPGPGHVVPPALRALRALEPQTGDPAPRSGHRRRRLPRRTTRNDKDPWSSASLVPSRGLPRPPNRPHIARSSRRRSVGGSRLHPVAAREWAAIEVSAPNTALRQATATGEAVSRP